MSNEWDERYRSGDTPWDGGVESRELVRVVEALGLRSGRALDVGCGTGCDSLWLARHGFEVTGIDFAPTAIERAEQRAAREGVTCRFLQADVLNPPDLYPGESEPPFDFIFDGGCFHVVRKVDEAGAVRQLRRWCRPEGRLLVLTGNADEQAEEGPPRLTEQELRAAFEGAFDILDLRTCHFQTGPQLDYEPLAWSALMAPKP